MSELRVRPLSYRNHFLKILPGAAFALLFAACAAPTEFSRRYDHYFPKHSPYLDGEYRRYYDRTMFGPPPAASDSSRFACTYRAFHGDAAAFHAFLHHPDREVAGEPSESWHYDCLLLIIRLGDARVAELLAREDVEIRETVGKKIESSMDGTRALNSSRNIRQPTKGT